VEEVHADCWADDGHVSEDFYSDVWITFPCNF
jgi:hypothetical protein